MVRPVWSWVPAGRDKRETTVLSMVRRFRKWFIAGVDCRRGPGRRGPVRLYPLHRGAGAGQARPAQGPRRRRELEIGHHGRPNPARRHVERRGRFRRRLPRPGGPDRPKLDRSRPDRRDLGVGHPCRQVGHQGDLHGQHGERRERPKREERSVRWAHHGRERIPDGQICPVWADFSRRRSCYRRLEAVHGNRHAYDARRDQVGHLSSLGGGN